MNQPPSTPVAPAIEKTNTPRIAAFDLARGLTVLLMPAIHVDMLYRRPAVQQSLLGDILAFIAEGPGAQLFMLLMGAGIVFSTQTNKAYVLRRSLLLLIAAYGLNACKFLLPLSWNGLPENLLAELRSTGITPNASFFFMIGDILHFAAIAYPLTWLVYRIKHYPYYGRPLRF